MRKRLSLDVNHSGITVVRFHIDIFFRPYEWNRDKKLRCKGKKVYGPGFHHQTHPLTDPMAIKAEDLEKDVFLSIIYPDGVVHGVVVVMHFNCT